MKKASKRLKRLLTAGALPLLALGSCITDREIYPRSGEGEAEVTFSIMLPGKSAPASRAMTEGQENEVATMDILAFEPNGNYVYTARCSGTDITTDGGNIRKKTFTVKLRRGAFDLVLLANARDLTGASFGGKTKPEALALIEVGGLINGKWPADGTRPIPMWGEKDGVEIDEMTDLTGSNGISLARMLARVDVLITGEAAGKFQLSSVHVYNYNTKGSIAPAAGQWDATTDPDAPKATAPNIPSSLLPTRGPVTYSGSPVVAATKCESEIYLFEAENHSGGGHTTGKDLLERTCLVVGGVYDANANGDFTDDGLPTYYRVDFSTGQGVSQSYLDILRNHQYIFSITKVSGEGYESAQIAFESAPVNIEADVLQWNDGGIEDIIFNGNYMLGVSPLRVELWAIGGTNNQIKVKTDYPQWSYELSDLPTLSDPSADPTNAEWLTINSHTAGQKYSGTMSGSTIFYDVVHNGTGATRTAYIHITAGRMTMTVAIKQDAYYIDRIYVSPTGNIAPDGETRTVVIEGFFDNIQVRAWDITNDIQIGTNQTVQAGSSESTSLIIPELWHPSDRTRPNDITIAFEYYNTQQSAWRLIRSDEQTSYFINLSSNHVPGANIIGIGETFTVEIWGNYPEVRLRAFDGTTSLFGATVPAGTTAQDIPVTENINVPNNPPVALRTVYLQYSVDGGANWINISSGVQQKGQYVLSTGRIVSTANAGVAMDWVTAMGIVGGSTDYNVTWYYSSYGGTSDNFTYTPFSPNGCGAYWEGSINDPRTGQGNWRLPTAGELQQMVSEGMIPQGLYWSSQESNTTWAQAWHDTFGLQNKNKNGVLGTYIPRCVRNP